MNKVFLLVLLINDGSTYEPHWRAERYTKEQCLAEISRPEYRARKGRTWMCWGRESFNQQHGLNVK